MTKKRIHLFIRGKVQGVFFRQAVKVTAIKNNTGGWARNLDDGRVEVLLEGDDEAVNAVVKWAHIGPANARVDEVKIKTEEFKNEFLSFEVLY